MQNEESIQEILNNPEKLLDLIRTVHNLLHVYEIKKIQESKPKSNETLGVNDSVELVLKDNNGNTKEVRKV